MPEFLDFNMPAFFVYILESNRLTEIVGKFSEGDALRTVLHFSSIDSEYQPILTKEHLASKMSQLPLITNNKGLLPIVHISAHGSPSGFELTCHDRVSWRELDEMLKPLHKMLGGSYLLCLSSCRGLAAINLAFLNPQSPLFGVVGTLKDVAWSDNVIGFATFYHLLKKGKTIKEAVSGMKSASGHNDYVFAHGPSVVNAYQKET